MVIDYDFPGIYYNRDKTFNTKILMTLFLNSNSKNLSKKYFLQFVSDINETRFIIGILLSGWFYRITKKRKKSIEDKNKASHFWIIFSQ